MNTSKKELLTQHLENGLSITRVQADYLYSIGSLTKEISVLRSEGLNIDGVWKFDTKGNKYKSYSLVG